MRIIRQKNPSGRLTYYTPDHLGMRRLTRAEALYLINTNQASWDGPVLTRGSTPGAPTRSRMAS